MKRGSISGGIALAMVLLTGTLPSRGAQRKFAVVAPERFRAALEPFLTEKALDLPTEFVALEAALRDTEGVDDPERLKRRLFDAWRSRDLGYALLVGDADVLPIRYMMLDRVTPPAFDVAFYPSDLYYADLARADGSFDDWNARRDGFHARYFGEVHGEKNKKDPINFDAIDYRPDIAVGRWPVSTEAEVATLVRKTLARGAARKAGAPWLRRAALFIVGGWIDAREAMDGVAAALGKRFDIEKRYYSDAARNDRTDPPNEASAITLAREGVGLLCHAGHGQDWAWEGSISVDSIPRLRNAERLPVMMSVGCSTARLATLPPYESYVDVDGAEHRGTNSGEVFTSPPPPPAPYQTGARNSTGLGEQLLRRSLDGAVAYIGCDTGSQPCAMTLLEGFAAAVGDGAHPRLGDCWKIAVSRYYDAQHLFALEPNDDWYPPSIFFQAMKFVLYGDPTLPM